MFCPNKECYMQMQPGKFCSICGVKTTENVVCEICKAVIDSPYFDKFCGQCGANLELQEWKKK